MVSGFFAHLLERGLVGKVKAVSGAPPVNSLNFLETFLCLLLGHKSHIEKLLWRLVVPGLWSTATDWRPSFTIMIIRNSLLCTFPLVLSSRIWLSRLLNTQLIALMTGCSSHLPLSLCSSLSFFHFPVLNSICLSSGLNSLSSHWSLCDD